MAEGDAVVLVYSNGSRKIVAPTFKTPRARRKATSKAIDESQEDPLVRAVLTSASSYDCFERLEKKARGKSVQQVLDNWKKYWTDKIDAKTLVF